MQRFLQVWMLDTYIDLLYKYRLYSCCSLFYFNLSNCLKSCLIHRINLTPLNIQSHNENYEKDPIHLTTDLYRSVTSLT